VRPDLIFHRSEMGFTVELTRDYEASLSVAPLWQRLAEKPDTGADEAMRRYIRDHVERAQRFLSGVSRRGQTLRRIATLLTELQPGFLETGNRAFLRPLTRQTLAESLDLDESVVSRAVSDKWVQLPGGEVVALDAFFGNSHAIRDALAALIASENPGSPYSDDEIADLLSAQGFPLARRTVAKYRSLEKILPARLRRRSMAA
jgi:RNA polymerase sigma-54 factor